MGKAKRFASLRKLFSEGRSKTSYESSVSPSVFIGEVPSLGLLFVQRDYSAKIDSGEATLLILMSKLGLVNYKLEGNRTPFLSLEPTNGLIVPNLHGAPALFEGSNSGFRYGFPSEW